MPLAVLVLAVLVLAVRALGLTRPARVAGSGLAAVVALAALVALAPPAGAGRTVLRYQAPVDGPIIDHFRPPGCPWCAGNRGIDFATVPGASVRASAAGIVTFAGTIGHDRFVVVAHADGLRTTYAYLATITVVAGAGVVAGAIVGTAGSELHFGVRRGATYLDPELLLAGAVLRPRLVPSSGATPRPPRPLA
jgi:murein DD-endopeptidase MepM/ murein hydrolase activator NlpD